VNNPTPRRFTGVCGLLAGILALVVVPLYFVYMGPPAAWNVLTRTLLGVPLMLVLIGFFIGLRQIIRTTTTGHELLGTILFSAGLAYASVNLVTLSMEAGVPLYTPDGALDPTIDGPLAAGTVLVHGPISRMLIATAAIAIAIVASRLKLLPRWVAVTGYLLGAANLAFVPSLYFGMNPANFYAANGWGSTASISLISFIWYGFVGLSVLRRRYPTEATGTHTLTAREPPLAGV
jgi:hypothetical protein